MKYRFLQLFSFAVILLLFNGCGMFSDQPSEESSKNTVTEVSKEVGFGCLKEGDLDCAQENYCAIENDLQADLRCCLSQFLKMVFSENSTALAKKLGYNPKKFSEIRKMSRKEIIQAKALPLGELFLLSKDEAPPLKSLVIGWAESLGKQGVTTADLKNHLRILGEDLEASLQCLNSSLSGFEGDEIEPDVFESEENLKVTMRDLLLIKFLLGTPSYLLQGISQYDWGFEVFPNVPVDDAFLEDINGLSGAEDSRLGDLSSAGASKIAGKFSLLVRSFDALKSFSKLENQPSRVDTFLNWRISEETQERASDILGAIYTSLKTGEWQTIPEEEVQVNLISLSEESTIPNGYKVGSGIPALERDAEGNVQRNKDFFKSLLSPVLRDL